MILIIDFGSQTTLLIGRRLRQIGVSYEYADPDNCMQIISEKKPSGIILSGGPASVYEKDAPTVSNEIFSLDIPILGICYGWQLMAQAMGGKVASAHKEYGSETIMLKQSFAGIDLLKFTVFMSHGDSVTRLPKGFQAVGSTDQVAYACVVSDDGKKIGTQFHPEADHTEYGTELLQYFAHELCGEELTPLELNPEEIITQIFEQVGDQAKVICAVSGGVDSTVAAFLIGKAIGKRLIPVYIESGLMRPNTRERVEYIFHDLIDADLIVVEAQDRFMKVLRGVTDPELKRKAIGKLYVDLFQEIAEQHQDVVFLGQGTIYSDVIESKGSKHASKIKSHHNVGGLPDNMKISLIEPLRMFFKDEVRFLGKLADLPDDVINQEPFPGPGYAIRIRGEVTEDRLMQVKIADAIVVEEIKRGGLDKQVFQAFAVMTGAMSTAVKGDGRVFAEVVAIRAYESKDIMTSRWAEIPYSVLQTISSRIVNEVPNVSRVVYDITTKPPATMEWE